MSHFKYMISAAATLASLGLATSAVAGETMRPADAQLYIANLEDGATVSSPVTVLFGLSGMGVAPAGVDRENTGHHHLLINRAPWGEGEGDAEMDEIGLAADENHRHFGGGQTQVTLDLPAGTHTLQLHLADWAHVPFSEPLTSDYITITVN